MFSAGQIALYDKSQLLKKKFLLLISNFLKPIIDLLGSGHDT